MKPDVSFVIVHWNTRIFLDRCLRSLARELRDVRGEVIVVDNASTDGSVNMVERFFPWVHLIANAENRQYAAANNQGIQVSRGRHVWLLNPDVEFFPGCVTTVLDLLQRRPDAGAAAHKLVHADGSLQRSVRTFPTPDVVLMELFGLSRWFPRSRVCGRYRMTWWDYDEEVPVDQPMAASLVVRRTVLDQVGLMDEGFPMFFNDVDLCYRIRQAGWKIYFTPRAIARHFGGASTRLVKRRMILASHASLRRFYHKHYRDRVPALWYHLALAATYLSCYPRLLWART